MPRRSDTSETVGVKYIAKLAGVSPSTVSRALRQDPTASAKTTEKILGIARELNYYPNSLAKGLRQERTQTIGIILNDLNNPFYTEILSVIGEVLADKGYTMVVSYSHYDVDRERDNILTLLARRVDGIIMSPARDQSENIKILLEKPIESVLIDCLPQFMEMSYVYTDHRKGAVLATEHLIKSGHRDILLLTHPYETSLANGFIDGYVQTLQEYEIEVREEYIVRAEELSIDSGYEAFKKLLTENSAGKNLHFTGIITISDLLAIGIYKAANELRFDIPGTYSIIGYDDVTVASALMPPLTTIHQPRKRIGIECTDILLHNITHEDKIVKKVAFEPYIVKRGSVRNIH